MHAATMHNIPWRSSTLHVYEVHGKLCTSRSTVHDLRAENIPCICSNHAQDSHIVQYKHITRSNRRLPYNCSLQIPPATSFGRVSLRIQYSNTKQRAKKKGCSATANAHQAGHTPLQNPPLMSRLRAQLRVLCGGGVPAPPVERRDKPAHPSLSQGANAETSAQGAPIPRPTPTKGDNMPDSVKPAGLGWCGHTRARASQPWAQRQQRAIVCPPCLFPFLLWGRAARTF